MEGLAPWYPTNATQTVQRWGPIPIASQSKIELFKARFSTLRKC